MAGWGEYLANSGNNNQGGGGYSGGSEYQGSSYSGNQQSYQPSFNWQDFLDKRSQVQQYNQQNYGPWGSGQYDQNGYSQPGSIYQTPYQQEEDRGTRSSFVDLFNGGTERMYNGRWQKTKALDNLAIEAAKGAGWWNNLPANLTGNQDLAFDASKFDLAKGFNKENLEQIGKFGISLPGMMVGGVLEGAADAYEGLTGRPINEYRAVKNSAGSPEYEIPDYELDMSQRGADFLDSAINIGGLFTGGSARLIGGAGKAIAAGGKAAGAATKAASVSSKLDRMSQGVLENAWAATGHAKPGAILQTGFDIAEEAGEEYVQSLAEDVRNKTFDPDESFDKASQAAAWGALGGGMMSVGGRGLSHLGNMAFKKDTTPAPQQDQFTYRANDYHAQSRDPGSFVAPQIREYETELFQQRSAEPGSGTVKCFMGRSDMMPDQADLSDQNLIAMYEEPGGAQIIQQDFAKIGISVTQLEDAMYRSEVNGQHVGSAADALNMLIEGKPAIQLIAQRTPGTKNGAGRVELRRFTHGDGGSLHPMAYGILGGDTDGDNMTFFFGADRMPQVEWFSSMLAHPEGASNASWWYSQIAPSLAKYPGEIDRVLASLKDYYTVDANGTRTTLFDKYSQQMKDAISGMSYLDGNDSVMSKLIMEIGEDVQSAKTAGHYTAQLTPPGGRMVKNQIINELSSSKINQIAKALEDKDSVIVGSLQDAFVSCGIEEDPVNFLRSRGSLKDARRAADLWTHMGFVEAVMFKAGNVPFRQYGQAGFTTKALQSHMSTIVPELQSMLGEKDVVKAFIRASFGMTASGVSPSTSIEGIIESFTVAETMRRCNMMIVDGKMSNTIKTQEDLNTFLDTYIEVYNSYTKVYEEAKKNATNLGDEYGVDFVDRNDLTGRNDPQLIDNLRRTFGSTPMPFLFDVSGTTTEVAQMTFGEFVDAVSKREGGFYGYFMNNGPKGNLLDFCVQIQRNYGTSKRRLSERIVNVFMSKDMSPALEYFDAHGEFGPYANSVEQYCIELASYASPEIVQRMGITDPYTMARNTIGRELFGKDRKKALDTYLADNLFMQFDPVIDMLKSDDEKDVAAAKVRLTEMAQISALHERIVRELLIEGQSVTLEYVTNPEIPFDTKRDGINETLQGEVDKDFEYVVDILCTENSDFGISAISSRVRQAESYSKKAVRMLYSDARSQVEQLRGILISDKGKDEQKARLLEGYIDEIALVMPAEVDLDLLGAQVHESLIIAHKAIEKGTIQQIASQLWDSLSRIRNGGTSPHLVTMFGLKNGIVDMDAFQSNYKLIIRALTDPNFKIRCTDPITGRNTVITQETIFASVGVDLRGGRKPNAYEWLNLFEEYPQLVDWMSRIKSNPAFTTKTDTTNPAKAQSFMSGFKRYSSAHEGLSGKSSVEWYDVDRGVRELSNMLLVDPQYKTYMIACLADELEDTDMSAEQLTKRAREFHEDFAKRAYVNLHSAPGGTDYQSAIQSAKSTMFQTNFSRFQTNVWLGLQIAQRREISQRNASALADFINMGDSTMAFTEIYRNEMHEAFGAFGVDTEQGATESLVDILQGEYDQVFDGIQRAYEGISDDVSNKMHTVAALFSYFSDFNVSEEVELEVDRTVVNEMKKRIADSMDAAITKATSSNPNIDTAALCRSMREYIESKTQDIVDRYESKMKAPVKIDNLIITDDDFRSLDSLAYKVSELYQYIGGYTRTLDEIKDEVAPALESQESMDEFRKFWLSNVIEHEINEVNNMVQGDMNPFIVPFSDDVSSFYDSLFSYDENSFRRQLASKKLIFDTSPSEVAETLGFSTTTPQLPTPNTTSAIAQIAATNMRIMDDAAGTAILVSINGAQMKQHFGFALLPSANKTSSHPIMAKVSDIRKLIDDDESILRWKMVSNGTWDPNDLSSYEIDTIGSQIEKLPDDAEIYYFDPIRNPHGLSNANTPATPIPAGRGNWHRLSAILGKLDDTTMEAMVMKAKKVFGSKVRIVDDMDSSWFDRKDTTLDVGDGSVIGEIRNKMEKHLVDFRRQYASEIANEFRKGGSLDSTKFDEEQAILLACAMTPGMHVTLQAVGPMQPGMPTSKEFVVDSNLLFGDPVAFQNYWGAMTEGGLYSVSSCEVFLVTPTEISYKIQNAVLAEYHLTDDVNNIDINDIAEKAAEDWSDFQFNTLPVSYVLNGIKPFGYHVPHGIRLSDSQTGPQIVLDDEYNGVFGESTRSISSHRTRAKFLDVTGSDKGLWNTATTIAKMLDIDGHVPGILKAYLPSDADMVFDNLDEIQFVNNTLRQISNQSVSGYYIDEQTGSESAGICLDQAKIADAMLWAAKTNNRMILPKSFLKLPECTQYLVDYDTVIKVNLGGYVEECVVFTPARSNTFRGASGESPTGHRLPVHPDDITLMFMDYDNFYKLTDAGIYATDEGAKIAIRRGSYAKFEADKLLPEPGSTRRIADKNMILRNSKLLACVDQNGNPVKDNKVWRESGIRLEDFGDRRESVKRMIADYLYRLRSQADDDGVMRTGSGGNQCVCFLTNGQKFVPIITPGNSASEYSYVDVNLIGNDLLIPWEGTSELGNARDRFGNEYFMNMKMAVDGEAFKGIVNVMPPEIGTPPMLAMKIGGKDIMVHFIASGETEHSRALGRGQFFQYQSYFEAMHKFNGSLLLTLQEDGTYDVNDWIKKNFTQEEIVDLFNGDPKIWNKIKNMETGVDANGNVKLYTLTQDSDINEAITMVLTNCNKYHLNPIPYFTSLVRGYDGKIRPDWSDANYFLAYDGLDFNKTALFFSGMFDSKRPEDQGMRFCPKGNSDPDFDKQALNCLFDDRGWTACRISFGALERGKYYPVRWGKHEVIGDESFLRTPTGEGKRPMQEFYRRAYDRGLIDAQYQRSMDYADFLTRNNLYMQEMALDMAKEKWRSKANSGEIMEDPASDVLSQMRDNPSFTFVEMKNRQSVASMGKTLVYHRTVKNAAGETVDPMTEPSLQTYIDFFRKTFGYDISFDIIDWWCKGQDGYTYNNGVGDDVVTLDDLKQSMRTVVSNFKTKGIPITVYDGGRSFDNRYALPCQIQAQIDWAWEHGNDFLKAKHGTKEEYARAIEEETTQALAAIKDIDKRDIGKRIRLSQYMQWYYREMGKPIPDGLYVYNNVYTMDIKDLYNDYAATLMGGNVITPEMAQDMEELADRERKKIAAIRNKVEMRDIRHRANVPITPGGVVSSRDYNDAWSGERVLNNIATVSQLEAVFHPFVTVSNLTDRFIGQTAMDWALRLGRKYNFGPYKSNHWLDPKIVDQAVNNPTFMRLYIAYRKAGFTGEEMVFLSNANSAEEINTWLDEREKNQTVFQKAADRIYGISSGGNVFIKTQMKNFLNRFCQFAETDGQDFWFADVGGISLLEASIAGDGAGKWFADVLGANDAYTPSFTIALQALNSAKQGDMAQRHVVSMMYGELVRRMPISKFFVTTTVSRFPQYALNVSHRMFSWVAPASSIYYVFTNMISKTKFGQDLNLEQAQVHRSLQEAMYVDLMHLGRSMLCMILIGCSGLMEPPDDEKKWQNIDDWTIGGFRVGSEWWMKDVLGMALPVAAFARASMLGRPDMNILSNGLADICFSNPIMRVNDAIGFIIEPEGGLITDYKKDVEAYADAPQGSPSLMEWLNVQAKAATLSWASQFITPSILRDFYVNSQQYEASYKRVFKSSATGVTATDETKTERTTYEDAMIRRVTRRNPTLAWVMEAMLHPETGYNWEDMPRTIYYDDAQREAAETWSIKGMDDQEANQKLIEIISVLQQYDDMNELRKTGFYLDAETRTALSSTVWDIYHGYDDWWNSINQTDQTNYYVLGNGSFEEGKRIYYEMKQDVQNQKQYWNNFYYDKIHNSYLSEPMQTYNRYNTTYARDAEGEVYATGIRPSGVLPFTVAPGTIDDPGVTAGYENDWVSVSAVTGAPMNQRALVPNPSESSDWPNLEDWAENGDGNSYSKRYRQQYGSSGSAYGTNGSTGSTSSGSKTYGKKSYGGGGGYRRRSSGGGGSRRSSGSGGSGYTPNLYGPSVSTPTGLSGSRSTLSKANPSRIMNTDRIIKPDEVYLRPDFETKGSREAYKRSDI